MTAEEIDKNPDDSFYAILAYDAIEASSRYDLDPSQANRRNLIRTLFATSEGNIGLCKQHIRDAAINLDEMTKELESVLSEVTHFVNERGEIRTQPRFISMTAMIRLLAREARRLSPEWTIDFGGQGWENFRNFINVRNRVTHPKSVEDLYISDNDAASAESAFFWLASLTEQIMQAANDASIRHLQWMTFFFERLKSGDDRAIALYNEAAKELGAKPL